MKKKMFKIITVSAIIMGLAPPTFAASKYEDVPKNNWAYGAVTKLAKDGIIEGYADGTFRGDKIMTRYEMAQIVANVMTKTEKLSAEDKKVLDDLKKEYGDELKALGADVDQLKSDVKTLKENSDVFVIHGMSRARFDSAKRKDVKDYHWAKQKADLWITMNASENWKGHLEYEYNNGYLDGRADMGDSYSAGWANGHGITKNWIEGNYDNLTVKLGRYGAWAGNGLVMDTLFTGGEVTFGNKLKTTLTMGNINEGVIITMPSVNTVAGYRALGFVYDAGRGTKFNAAYHRATKCYATNNADRYGDLTVAEVGIKTPIMKDWTLKGGLAKGYFDKAAYTGVYKHDTGTQLELKYKGADRKVAKSYDYYAGYQNVAVMSQIDTTYDWTQNSRGWYIGADYVPSKMLMLGVKYQRGKAIDPGTAGLPGSIGTGSNGNQINVFRAEAILYF